jgi:nitroimidazol reductase NimA-like FMN-containing flavoprotein (pyridoxamine 5'-phosphate oxidase superfamily)
MRRRDREIESRSEIDTIIRSAEVCRLAFAVENEPYIVPVSFGYDGSAIYFHTARDGRKIDCIRANPRVCFELECNVELLTHDTKPCDWGFSYESVIGYGTVIELSESEERRHGLNQVMLQYSEREWMMDDASMDRTRVWRLDIESVTGKRSTKKDT